MQIADIRKDLVKCDLKCDGIINNPEKGIIPRCLYLEERSGKNGVIAIGLNPGKSGKEEREFFSSVPVSSERALEFWENKYKWQRHYYVKTREIINLLGFDGNILWTEIVKCESKNKRTKIPQQTIRTCIHKFLNILKLANQPLCDKVQNPDFSTEFVAKTEMRVLSCFR